MACADSGWIALAATSEEKRAAMKLNRLTEFMQIRGVRVYAHWSLLLIAALILVGAIERPAET
jgi:hypothetical protein